jgi:hypothetical protein
MTKKEPLKNYIGMSRDHSGSMRNIARAAARDYNDNIAAIREASVSNGQDTIVSVVKCGVGRTGTVERESVFSSVQVLKDLAESAYDTDGASTPLWDSVGDLIEQFECAPDVNEPGVSFLIMAITDGQENSSRKYNARTLAQKMNQLQATDRWSFVFRVPRGGRYQLENLGIPSGNILEWDQTERGVQVASAANLKAFTNFYESRSKGLTSTRGFYTTDLTGVSAKTIASKLIDISGDVKFWNVDSDAQIRPFVEGKLGKAMKKGGAFYQLMKKEDEVQDYKVICIRDKKSGAVYTGVEARNVLGLPHHGTVKVAPGNHGGYDIFIQSTSVNRRLVKGTQLMYWENVGQPYSAPTTMAAWPEPTPVAKTPTPVTKASVKATVAAVVNSSVSAEYINGYRAGFETGKAKGVNSVAGSRDYSSGFAAGYKDGRGKKKRQYK